MTITFATFTDRPVDPIPPVSSLALHALWVVLSVLLICVLAWSGIIWVSALMSASEVYVEGIDPVLPEYYSGFGR